MLREDKMEAEKGYGVKWAAPANSALGCCRVRMYTPVLGQLYAANRTLTMNVTSISRVPST